MKEKASPVVAHALYYRWAKTVVCFNRVEVFRVTIDRNSLEERVNVSRPIMIVGFGPWETVSATKSFIPSLPVR